MRVIARPSFPAGGRQLPAFFFAEGRNAMRIGAAAVRPMSQGVMDAKVAMDSLQGGAPAGAPSRGPTRRRWCACRQIPSPTRFDDQRTGAILDQRPE
jgi:hypothetical protein